MEAERKLLLEALRRSVGGASVSLPEAVDWESFLRLARFHNVEALAFSGLQEQVLPEAVRNKLMAAYNRAIFRDAQLEHTCEKLRSLLEEAKIPHIFLKGAVLKHNYPIPALRTMSDLDVLVYTRDYPQIDKLAQSMGGKLFKGDGNHRNFSFPGEVAVEFHPNLLHHATAVASGVNPGWQYAREGENALTEEGFYLSLVTHIAEHFVGGGIGVRFVLDIWVFLELRRQPMDRAFVDRELERFGILEFAKNLETLALVWFGTEPATELTRELGEYILSSGIHGLQKREILNAVALSGGRFGALWKKAFYPRAELEDRYPWAKGRPLLLPAAWCCRAFGAIKNHAEDVQSWQKESGKVTQQQIREQRKKLKRFGLKW